MQWHRDQLSQLREQLLEAQRELGRLHLSMSSMVLQKSVVYELQAASDLQQEAAFANGRRPVRELQTGI